MKILKKAITITAITVLCISTLSYAAIPTDTVIVPGVKRAYDFQTLMSNHNAIRDVLSALDSNSPIYVKLGENMIIDLKHNFIEKSQITELTYYDANGNEEHYEANDGDKVDVTPGQPEGFEVLDIY